jgi:hypothetical protein
MKEGWTQGSTAGKRHSRNLDFEIHIRLQGLSEYFPAAWEPTKMQEDFYAAALTAKLVEAWEKLNGTSILTAQVEVSLNRPLPPRA